VESITRLKCYNLIEPLLTLGRELEIDYGNGSSREQSPKNIPDLRNFCPFGCEITLEKEGLEANE
jgi:hypothetical protein